MSSFQKFPGVVKKQTRLTGNQRKQLRMEEASKTGISERDILLLRRAQMEQSP
jgi:hypothetical protein